MRIGLYFSLYRTILSDSAPPIFTVIQFVSPVTNCIYSQVGRFFGFSQYFFHESGEITEKLREKR